MIGGKVQGAAAPTAIGTLLNQSAYGATIPTIYGTARSSVLAIWGNHLRAGGSWKKAKKKGIQTYVEQIDFLIGANPIEGVLQAWTNNTTRYPLNFVKLTETFNAETYTIADAHFYMLVAVTVSISNRGTFADYGATYPSNGPVTSAYVSGSNPGSGYAVNDTFTIGGTGTGGTGHVTSIGAGGSVTGIAIDDQGTDYTSANVSTTATSGSGNGLQIQIAAGGGDYANVSELSLYNVAQQGPDLIDGSYQKFWPWIYKWVPGDGSTVTFPSYSLGWVPWTNAYGPSLGDPYINFYYAQLSSATKYQTPLYELRLTFEPVLGDGTEYEGFTSQQILYPQYAGAGSPNFDLGASAMIPDVRLEVKGSFARFAPRGDADFCDMIEDTIKSGMLQTGSELGLIQRGVNANTLPGTVQKTYFTSELFGAVTRPISQPIAAGDILVAGVGYRSGTPAISDAASNTWIPVQSGTGYGFFYAVANGNIAAGNEVTITTGGDDYDPELLLVEMDPGSTVVDNTATSTGTSGVATCSIAVTGSPTYIIAFLHTDLVNNLASIPVHWADLFPNGDHGWQYARMVYRVVAAPGTYSCSLKLGLSDTWVMGMIALKSAQPVPYPATLGNILDPDTLNVVRNQCAANGLVGSVAMNSQQKAQDWLEQFYQCANASPVWSGFTLKSIANSEVSTVGNGVVYTAPTASGPRFNFTIADLVGDAKTPPVTVTRKSRRDSWNIAQLQFYDRANDYNQGTASLPLSGAIALFGPRKDSPMNLPEITDPSVAQKILSVYVQRYNLLLDEYKFTLMARCLGVEAKDLVTIPDTISGGPAFPVMMTSVKENENGELECTAEPFVYGANAPNFSASGQSSAPNNTNSSYVPDLVNAPVVFEPPPRMWATATKPELWIAVSDADTDYGGCVVLVSTDGGNSYNPLGTISGNATTGVTTGDWPAAADPDTANNLPVDLTESNGELSSYSTADENEFTYPCYVAGGTTAIPYELMTYAVATLTATSKYTLLATGTGNELRRSVYAAPTVGEGVDHPLGSRFLFIGQAPVGGTRPGFLIVPYDPSWIGTTLHFKFQAFNSLQGGLQDESSVTDYTYAPTGAVGSGNPNYWNYTLSGGALTNPTSTSIHMAQATATWADSHQSLYNARTFTITAPTSPTPYYLTVYDPGMLGDTPGMTNLSAYCETTNAKVGEPGYVYIGSIVAQPSGSGTQTSGGGSTAAQIGTTPLVIGFSLNSGAVGTKVAPDVAAARSGTFSKCKITTTASDASTDLTVNVKQNGTTIFATNPTVAHGTSAGTVSTFTSFVNTPVVVLADDVFEIDIVSGTASWVVSVQLET